MALIEVKKVKTKWRAVEFDGSQGSETYEEVNELFNWAGTYGYGNYTNTHRPHIAFPEKKPAYPGEKRDVHLRHGDYIVANNRGKVEVMDNDEFYERFKEKNK